MSKIRTSEELYDMILSHPSWTENKQKGCIEYFCLTEGSSFEAEWDEFQEHINKQNTNNDGQ